jgi:hypothetical protein
MLKAVTQVIPTYCMSIFLLPKTLCEKINNLMIRFWWRHQQNDRKTHWLSWNRLGQSKTKGGLGFRDLEVFSLALLAKQGWRLIQHPDSLVAKVMREKYYPQWSFLKAQLGRNPSFAWRSIFNAWDVLDWSLIWRVSNGEQINIWGDHCLPMTPSHFVQFGACGIDRETKVSLLIDQNSRWWDYPFNVTEARQICSFPLSPCLQPDWMIWSGTKNGCFSVRSAYHMEMTLRAQAMGETSLAGDHQAFWRAMGKLEAPAVLKHFVWNWKVGNNLLPTKANLFLKNIEDAFCPICLTQVELTCHILWECLSSVAIWQECGKRIQKLALVADDGLVLLRAFTADRVKFYLK